MRLFINGEGQKNRKKEIYFELVVAKAKVRNHRVITQKKLLKDISMGRQKKPENEASQALLRNTDDIIILLLLNKEGKV